MLLLLIGWLCQQTMSRAHWSAASSGATQQASVFFVGRDMLRRVHLVRRHIEGLVRELLAQIADANWG